MKITDYDQLDETIADIPLHFYHCFYLFLEAERDAVIYKFFKNNLFETKSWLDNGKLANMGYQTLQF